MPKIHGKQLKDSTVTSTQALTGTPIGITSDTSAEGTSSSLARSDHQHSHGELAGGALHAAATPSLAGFLSASDKAKLDALVDPLLIAPKDSVRALSTSNVSTLSGPQTVDGVSCVSGDRVALFGQTVSTEDGIYTVQIGAWTRTDDFASGSAQAGALIPVEEGTANADTLFLVTNDSGSDVVGTDDLVAEKYAGAPRTAGAGLVLSGNAIDIVANADGSIVVNADDIQVGVISDAQHGNLSGGALHASATPSTAGFMSAADKTKIDGVDVGAEVNDTPQQEFLATQNITGTDTALVATLSATPVSDASVVLHLNGVKQDQGVGKDYTISGTAITWLASSGYAVDMDTTDILTATYLS